MDDVRVTQVSQAPIPLIPDIKNDRARIVELKNGRVNFKQKVISFEKLSETLQEIVQFRAMLEKHIEGNGGPLNTFPEDYRPLVAKLAHESDRTMASLTKHVRRQLLPAPDDEDEDNTLHNKPLPLLAILPLQVVESAIKCTLTRNNYGLDNFKGGKTPAALCVWRWEVMDEHRGWLPKSAREKAETRIAERIQAKQDLRAMFDALPQDEQDALTDPKGPVKLLTREMNKQLSIVGAAQTATLISETATTDIQNSHPTKSKPSDEIENNSAQIVPVRPGRPKNLEKAAKAEKEKREKEAQSKIMANFFAKPKALTHVSSDQAEPSIAGPSRVRSDYERTFKPFALKKDATMAPMNWFSLTRERHHACQDVVVIDSEHEESAHDEVIAIDSHESSYCKAKDVDIQETQPLCECLAHTSPQAHLQALLRWLPLSIHDSSPHGRSVMNLQRFKTYHQLSVRDILTKLSEAEIAGDIPLVRLHLSNLRNRSLIPAKVFVFHEDARPGYFGTWTRSSQIIGPRTPFARDVRAFDYGYDSGEEWEEEPMGDADDVAEDEDDDGGAGDEERDSDIDSWLVDDDEVAEEEGSEPGLSPPPLDNPLPQATKRKAEEEEKRSEKKRKAVVPLIPFGKGPCWEQAIGKVEYEPFKPYRIQLFNDTPLSINPFTFVSTCVEDKRTAERKVAQSSDGVFAVPLLPDRLVASTTDTLATPSSSSLAPAPAPKKAGSTVKTPFPDTHLPFLLNKISELQASSIILLVETIYQELRVHKVKKNAIEAKVREVGEKDKTTRVWVVKT